MPWRDAPTPYRVLLSELMLQQTRVQTVVPFFHAFLARWPQLEDLAAATEQEVLEAWAGLGYYSRARNLHRAAQRAASMGGIPQDVGALRELPGVGPYTAGAVASIAFGAATPAIDGNVERVLSRLDGLEEDPKGRIGQRAIELRARELVSSPLARPGDLNQALMELGATLCAPRKPDCAACPWRGTCAAHASGDPERLPLRAAKRAPKPMLAVAGLLWRDGAVLMGQRPPRGLLASMWEPIGAELAPGEDPAPRIARAFAEHAGLRVTVGARLGRVIHLFTHRRLVLQVYGVEGEGRPMAVGAYSRLRFVDPASPGVPLSKLARKAVGAL
jgi:A/G-specific adenine glycosylase